MRAEFFALLAAISNAMIGPLTRFGFLEGASPNQIAFFKAVIAFIILLSFTLIYKKYFWRVVHLRHQAGQLAVLAFLGIFCLYFFETTAFSLASIPTVAFLTYAGGVASVALSTVILKEPLTRQKIIAFMFILIGVYMIIVGESGISGSLMGIVYALVGGLGYALFIFFAKLFKIGGGFAVLVWLFGFGSLFLSVPYTINGGGLLSAEAFLMVVALVLVPTIGGFYFTTKAVSGGEAGRVQIIETSDPLFATAFGFLLFGDRMSLVGWGGAAFIFSGLVLVMMRSTKEKRSASVSAAS